MLYNIAKYNKGGENMDFIITRNLHQITPYIHFQHSDYGATLRPTEVKPKLDRYLIEIFSKNSPDYVEKLKKNNWFVGISTALNYKMKITAPSESENVLTDESEFEIKTAKYLLEQSNNDIPKTLEKARKIFSKEIKKNHSFYFANMVSTRLSNCKNLAEVEHETLEQMVKDHVEAVKSTFKESVKYNNPLKLEIICLNKELRELIKDNIDMFFITHNFGCRQTKGFGSFVTEDFHKKNLDFYKTNISNFGKPFFCFKASGSGRNPASYTEALNQAFAVYSIMKAGMNRTGLKRDDQTNRYFYRNSNAYIKGYSMRQYLPEGTGSEKSMIKGKILTNARVLQFRPGEEDREPKDHNGYNSYTFMRAIFGLTDSYKFADPRRNGTITVLHLPSSQIPPINNGMICVTKDDLKKQGDACIQRFPSPVLIKIIEDNVFFIFNDSYEKMLGKSFIFLSEYDLRDIESRGSKNIPSKQLITTPSEFDPKEFINGFITYFTAEKRKLQHFPPEYKSAQNIQLEGGNSDD